MVITLRAGASQAEIDRIRERAESLGLRTFLTRGESRTIVACVGLVEPAHQELVGGLPGVESIVRISKPWHLAGRAAAAGDTVVRAGDGPGARVGARELAVIAGPCSVEGLGMLREVALAVRAAGAGMLRGGAFKPRTSPWAFRGLGREALELLAEVRRETGLPVVTEVMDTRQVDLVAGHADHLEVGFELRLDLPLRERAEDRFHGHLGRGDIADEQSGVAGLQRAETDAVRRRLVAGKRTRIWHQVLDRRDLLCWPRVPRFRKISDGRCPRLSLCLHAQLEGCCGHGRYT